MPEDAARPSTPGSNPPHDGLRLLAVEDHGIGRVLIQAMLAPLGVDATIVADGAAALREARREPFDVIFVDLGLPDVPGERLAVELAASPGGRHAAIVAVTGRARPAEIPAVFGDWLEKPFSVRDLDALLRRLTPPLKLRA
ncbi:MAG: response regulator [Hyphomicrobiales bacterium]|nr:response regulator [Hyphomicrobiales bacterium]